MDKILLTYMLSQRAGIAVNSEAAEDMYFKHHKVLEERADRWLKMPLWGAAGQGPVGTFVHEVPKQIALSVGDSAKPLVLMTTTLTFGMRLNALKIPQAMEHVAGKL